LLLRRFIAEIGAVGFGCFATLLPAGILVATAANLFWPAFILLGTIFTWFARPWMLQVLEVKPRKAVIKA
jgi:hypothetical protein